MMSDETRLHLTGRANKHNSRYWALSGDNPHIIHEKPLQNTHVNTWAGVAEWGMVKLSFIQR